MAAHRTPRYHPAPTPRHRRPKNPIRLDGVYVMDVANDAKCECSLRGWAVCPRHNPDTYADQQARHATDSIAPVYGFAR